MKINRIWDKVGWVIAIVLLIFNIVDWNAVCLDKSVELSLLHRIDSSKGYWMASDLEKIKKASDILSEQYPELVEDGWRLILESQREGDTITVIHDEPFSSELVFYFGEDGSFSLKANR